MSYFLEDLDINNVLVSNTLKNDKYFIGCLYDDYRYKPVHKNASKNECICNTLNGCF